MDSNTKKLRASDAVRKAVYRGKLLKPDICSECGKGGIIHGHHTDYDKPLEVEWLCPVCHTRRHPERGAHNKGKVWGSALRGKTAKVNEIWEKMFGEGRSSGK